MTPQKFQSILDTLWPEGETLTTPQVYAVLDGARDRRIEPMIRFSRLQYECLYDGKLTPDLRTVAPYLMHLAPKSAFTRDIIEKGWGNAWGFFLIAPADAGIRAIRGNLRRIHMVKDENGRTLIFRYYDPRVLRIYLPTCTGEEAKQVFGPASRILMEAEDSNSILSCGRTLSEVELKEISLVEIKENEPRKIG